MPDPPPAALSKPAPKVGAVGSKGALTGAFAASARELLVGAPPKTDNPAESKGQDSACGPSAGPAILGADALEPGPAAFTGVAQRECAVAAEFPEAGGRPDEDVWVII
jgi:hypothetical protein